jgi:serine/threonine protein kinase
MLANGAEIAGRYHVVGLLGHGGMGAVYEVTTATGAHYAMKVAWSDLDDDGQAARRLAREANTLQLLDHPGIVAVIDVVAERGQLYLVVELVRGRGLAALAAASEVSARRALVLVRQMLDAIEHAHGRGVVHRDLKPDNVLVAAVGAVDDPYDQVKLLDFGLVKLLDAAAALVGGDRLTRTGVAFGTPAYMAPEQALGRPVDGRADLYAVGVILFELLTGRLPFIADDALTLLRAHVGAPPPRLAEVVAGTPWCSPTLEALVAGALAKSPSDRFATAAAMRACLDDAFVTLP